MDRQPIPYTRVNVSLAIQQLLEVFASKASALISVCGNGAAQLQDVKLMHKRTMTAMSAESAKLDAQIEAALQRLRALDFEKQCNAEKISLLGGDVLRDKGSLRPS
ncbi:hypothetical protein COCOBI_05-1950 [Coccomyxa sp. Obi]|nr:hypothetical protein COCOBI_05-1950 [Coccomyxa sp. Obi]